MATYLGSWRVVYTGNVPSKDLASIEESFYVGDPSDVGRAVSDIGSTLRQKLRHDAAYRESLGVTATPECLNVVFQSPLMKIDL